MAEGDFESWASEEIARIQSGINLQRPSDHESIFKYISLNSEFSWEYLEKTLSKSELSGSTAAYLNDPFEMSPFIFDDLRPATIADVLNYSKLAGISDEEEPCEAADVFSNTDPYKSQALQYLEDVASRYKIIAFSERVDSGLLWSHYANSYQGACLHFLARGFHWHSRHMLGRVTYSKHRPAYPLSLALALSTRAGGPPIPFNATPLRRAESNQILFFTKAEDWAYETEVRIVYDPSRTSTIKFKENCLISIIIGPKFSNENLLRLKYIISNLPNRTISVRRAKLSQTTFSVELDRE